jgi:hypothetical protein
LTDSSPEISGHAWDAATKRWLTLKYPNDFQSVPATDKGDAGIEGYCISEREVFQSYAPLAMLDTKTMYEKQRDKLTEDTGKFVRNRTRLEKILPKGFRVRRYEFLVPELRSSDLLAHANKKAEEVRNANLPYVDPEFAILVRDKSYFEPQIVQESNLLLVRLHLENRDVTTEEITDWSSGHNEGVANLDRKIGLYTSLRRLSDIARKRQYWVEAKIRAENALTKLRAHSEELWEKLWGVKQAREQLLASQYGEDSGKPESQVRSISNQLALDMIGRVPNLERLDADMLAEGLVGEWLQNCKLDFPEPA